MSRKTRKEFLSYKEKEVVFLLKRLNELYKAKNNLGYVTITPPLRAGWVRKFGLKPSCMYRRDYNTLADILSLIQNTVVCTNKDFLRKSKRKKKVPIEQNPLDISDKTYNRLSEEEQAFFTKKIKNVGSYSYPIWQFRKPELLIFDVKPHFITKVKIFDEDLETEITEIRDRLWGKENLYARYAKDKPSPTRDYKTKTSIKTIILDKEVEEYYDDYVTSR